MCGLQRLGLSYNTDPRGWERARCSSIDHVLKLLLVRVVLFPLPLGLMEEGDLLQLEGRCRGWGVSRPSPFLRGCEEYPRVGMGFLILLGGARTME